MWVPHHRVNQNDITYNINDKDKKCLFQLIYYFRQKMLSVEKFDDQLEEKYANFTKTFQVR